MEFVTIFQKKTKCHFGFVILPIFAITNEPRSMIDNLIQNGWPGTESGLNQLIKLYIKLLIISILICVVKNSVPSF